LPALRIKARLAAVLSWPVRTLTVGAWRLAAGLKSHEAGKDSEGFGDGVGVELTGG
jgi:hypothetical protein